MLPDDFDYTKLYLISPFADSPIHSFMALLLLGLMRIMPIVGFVPCFGANNLNRPAKIFLGMVVVMIMLPKLILSSHTELRLDYFFLAYALKELFVGFSIAFIASIPFYIAETAGVFIDHQRGASSLMVNDPLLLNQNAPMGILFNYIGIVFFFWVGGPDIFLNALLDSYDLIPPDSFLGEKFFLKDSPFFKLILDIANKETSIAIQLAAPALIIMLMTDMVLGIINRLAPQVMITFLGMPLKSLLGIMVVWLGWEILVKQISTEYLQWLEIVKKAIFWMNI